MSATIIDEIEAAISALGLSTNDIRLLSESQSEEVRRNIIERYVLGEDRAWWWEFFREPGFTARFENDDGWKHLPDLAPNETERVWFVAEESALPQYPVFLATPRTVSAIISECYAFEYYMVAEDFSWLVCENHHNVVYAIGESVEKNLRRIAL